MFFEEEWKEVPKVYREQKFDLVRKECLGREEVNQ